MDLASLGSRHYQLDEFIHLFRVIDSTPYLLVVYSAIGDIVENAVVEKDTVLRYDSYGFPQVVESNL